MKALVTGGAGFIGSWVVDILVNKAGIISREDSVDFTEKEWKSLENFEKQVQEYQQKELSYSVRGKEIKQKLNSK